MWNWNIGPQRSKPTDGFKDQTMKLREGLLTALTWRPPWRSPSLPRSSCRGGWACHSWPSSPSPPSSPPAGRTRTPPAWRLSWCPHAALFIWNNSHNDLVSSRYFLGCQWIQLNSFKDNAQEQNSNQRFICTRQFNLHLQIKHWVLSSDKWQMTF